jgi:bifunctional non-homologous end joining protein LigD
MAKDLRSRYCPGQRSPAWRKIKPTQTLPCVVIGYTPTANGLHSLLVASVCAGVLRYVAQLTRGLAPVVKANLARRLGQRHRLHPVVVCPHAAQWVEPEVYCQVRFFGWTKHGHLRDAVFRGLLSPA